MASNTEQRKIQIIADGKQVNASMSQMAASTKILYNQLRKLPHGSDDFLAKKNEYLKVRDNLTAVKKEVYGTETAFQKLVKGLGPVLAGFSAIMVFQKVKDFLFGSSEAAKVFEKSLDSLQSITGATAEDMAFYRKEAELMGETTIFSAQQAADAFTIIGSKKPELLQSKDALAEVTRETLTLAEAAMISLPEAADTMTLALNKFQLPASEAARVADVLAAAYRNGSIDIQQTGFQLSKFGGIAKTQNISLEQSAATVQVVGKTVDESGTKIRNVLLKLASGADETNPAVVGLDKALENLGKQNLDTAEMAEKFGTENAEAAIQMVNNRKEIEAMTEKVSEQGVALEMAATNTDNLDGDLKGLESVTESWKIKLGDLINSGLRPVVQFLTAFLLGLKELPKFIYENRALLIGLTVGLIAFNGQMIMSNALALKDISLKKAQVIWTNASTVATNLLNFALKKNPIGFVIGLVIALIGVFVNLYNKNEKVRAAIQGLFGAAKASFTAIRNVAMKALGGLGDLLLGLITFDGDQIKKGWNNLKSSFQEVGQETAAAFRSSYNAEIDKSHEEELAKQEQHGMDVLAVEEDNTDLLLEEQKKKSSWKEDQEEEHRKKMLKLRDEFNKAELESAKALEDLRIEVMEDGLEKRLAKHQLELDRELAKLEEKRKIVLENEAITEEEKNRLLAEYDEQARLNKEAKKQADDEARLTEREEELERLLGDIDEEEALKQERLEQHFLTSLNSDFAKEQARLNLQKEFLRRRLEILDNAGQAETLQAQKLRTAILKIDKELADGSIENEKRTQEFKKDLRDRGLEAAQETLRAGLDLLGEETMARKIAATALKAFEIGKVITEGISEIAGYWSKTGPIPFVGPGLATGLSIAAAARTAVAVGKISSTKYAHGGGTGNGATVDMIWNGSSFVQPNGVGAKWVGSHAKGGRVNNPSLGLIGEAGSEWVAPNWMIRSPRYANIIGYLEAARTKGRAFADGGNTTSTIPQYTSASADLQGQIDQFEQWNRVEDLLREISDKIGEWPTTLKVVNDVNSTLDAIEMLNEIESDSRISR